MNPDQQAALDRVPRFLDDLEPIDSKKLSQDNKKKERWSLSGKQDDSQVLAEMGVAPLNSELSDEERIPEPGRENIENLSPNLNSGRCNKRTYLQAVLSPKGAARDKLSEDHLTGAKKSRVMQECDINANPGSSVYNLIEDNFTQYDAEINDNIKNKALANVKTGHRIMSPLLRNANYKKGENYKDKYKHIHDTVDATCTATVEAAAKENESRIVTNTRLIKTTGRGKVTNEEDSKTNGDQNVLIESENITDRADDNVETNASKIETIEDNITNCNEGESGLNDDFNQTKDVFSISEGEEDVNKASNKYVSNIVPICKSEPHSDKCEENECPLSTVDQAILDYTEEDLEHTMVHDKDDGNEGYYEIMEEKECFTLQDQSFYSGERYGNSARCGSEDLRDTEDDVDSMFSKLSDEVVLSILQWLPKRVLVRCMHVCKRWRRLAADGRLWARVDLGGRVLPSGALQTLMDRHPLVLRMANAQLTSPALLSPSSNEWRVQFLDLSCATLSPQCVTSILYNSPQLLKLSLEALTLDSDAHKALERLHQLRTLNASQVVGFNIDCARSLANMTKLEHLNIAWTRLDTEGLNVLVSSLNPGLVRLNLAGCRKTIMDETVVTLLERLPNLMELDLSDAAHITTNSIKAIVQLNALEHLAISRCYCLQLRDYILLSQCRSLLYVDAFGILPPLNIPVLHTHLPNIQFNKFMHSSIARPTVGNRRTSIWGLRTRD